MQVDKSSGEPSEEKPSEEKPEEPEETKNEKEPEETQKDSKDQPSNQEPQGENIRNILQTDDKDTSDEMHEFRAFPRPYIVGKILEEVEIASEIKDNVKVCVSELECQWTWGKPMGTKISTKQFFDLYIHRKVNRKPLLYLFLFIF